MEPATNLRFEWVTEPQRFLALRDEWNLLGSSAVKTVFLTHAWLATWLQELAPDAELHVLTAWEEDRLVAAFPLFGIRRGGPRSAVGHHGDGHADTQPLGHHRRA